MNWIINCIQCFRCYEFHDRDELCRNGDVLSSPALSFSVKDLTAMVDVVRQEKLLKEQPEEEVEVKDKDSPAVSAGSSFLSFD